MSEPVLVARLDNIGNTCYLNSALQCLANQGHFIAALRHIVGQRPIRQGPSSRDRQALIRALMGTLEAMETSGDSVRPFELLKTAAELNPTFESHQQADAAELLLTIMSALDDELQSKVVIQQMETPLPEPYATLSAVAAARARCNAHEAQRKNLKAPAIPIPFAYRSVVSDFFQGVVLSTLTCPSCGELSQCADPFMTVEMHIAAPASTTPTPERTSWLRSILNIIRAPYNLLFAGEDESAPTTLTECFASHCAEEHLSQGNRVTCGHCGASTQARRALTFVTLPDILVVHLKRFRSTGYFNHKIRRYVECPETLDLTQFTVGAATPSVYELDGVVNHHGDMGGGHYTSYAKKRGVGWVLFNDERIAKAHVKEVVDSEVYVCVYRRKQKEESSAGAEVRAVARAVLEQTPEGLVGSCGGLFVSRSWLCRAAWLTSDPGPITNRPCYCDNEGPQLYTEVSEREWDLLHARYGGGPKIGLEAYAALLLAEKEVFP